jgi:oligopeptide/dipeptide ABC transporter ATP-binding protein
MCQRVMIALALACRPALLIADEPTTGLDVTTQAAIMELIRKLSAERGMSTLLITHDLHLAAESCDRLLVMHAGHVVEQGPTEALLAAPRHPYTAQLLRATPQAESRLADLSAIPGQLPDLRKRPLPPCRFSERCERAAALCGSPPVVALAPAPGGAPDHLVACRNPLP